MNDNSLRVHQQQEDKIDDVQKQNTWRKAHGIEDKEGLGPWMPAEERLKLMRIQAGQTTQEDASDTETQSRRKPVKKWLGIW